MSRVSRFIKVRQEEKKNLVNEFENRRGYETPNDSSHSQNGE